MTKVEKTIKKRRPTCVSLPTTDLFINQNVLSHEIIIYVRDNKHQKLKNVKYIKELAIHAVVKVA
ncbi:MAG: hypothetical protein U9R60_00535 [Bacteroidota bacterium]|nr:hypothetical protein [Bacteroidota bacterium]